MNIHLLYLIRQHKECYEKSVKIFLDIITLVKSNNLSRKEVKECLVESGHTLAMATAMSARIMKLANKAEPIDPNKPLQSQLD